jgi:ABC-type antimicrobial peptide transport system permease subunit
MFSAFASMALLLASVGLYAVMAHSISQRTQEIGVRMAMGATRQSIIGMVVVDGMRQLIVGFAVGLAASFGLTRILSALLVGVTPADPLTLVTVGSILALAALVGTAIPARLATRIDPIAALRYQ